MTATKTERYTRHQWVQLHGGPCLGVRTRIYPKIGGNQGGLWPDTIVICYGGDQQEPWPHRWATYHRWPDGTYRWQKP